MCPKQTRTLTAQRLIPASGWAWTRATGSPPLDSGVLAKSPTPDRGVGNLPSATRQALSMPLGLEHPSTPCATTSIRVLCLCCVSAAIQLHDPDSQLEGCHSRLSLRHLWQGLDSGDSEEFYCDACCRLRSASLRDQPSKPLTAKNTTSTIYSVPGNGSALQLPSKTNFRDNMYLDLCAPALKLKNAG